MNGLILDLLNSGAPAWAVMLIIVLAALTLLTGAAAKLIRAAHPGRSADAVEMQKNRIEHRKWKAERRDRRRRERAARRTERRAVRQTGATNPESSETHTDR
ncbi:hypothetical protein [Streptomyces sp. NPDC000877]|jgi:hypothetical protein|uniref:hypothetical protein n=1 Tax=unclassified Streptomyces TaxID=2593676 RepID=UPI003327EF7E